MTMPRYKCHKEVGALKVASAIRVDNKIDLTFDDGEPLTVSDELVSRYFPGPGDYLVQYEDGYMAFSPGKAFEDGYTLLVATG